MAKEKGKNFFSHKYMNAEIDNISNNRVIVHIKYVIGDLFLAEIEKQIYCFRIDGSKMKIIKNKLTRTYRVLNYDTSHYLPISSADINMMEKILTENNLPKIDGPLYGILKLLAVKEKKETPVSKDNPHDILKLVEAVVGSKNTEHAAKIESMKNYMETLGTGKIITPVKKLVDFIDKEIKVTDPAFMGSIGVQLERTDKENRIMTNRPETGKKDFIKLVLIIVIGVSIVGIIGFAWATGMIHLPSFPTTGGVTHVMTSQEYMSAYPTPEALKAAINKGIVDYQTLPKDVKDFVNSAK